VAALAVEFVAFTCVCCRKPRTGRKAVALKPSSSFVPVTLSPSAAGEGFPLGLDVRGRCCQKHALMEAMAGAVGAEKGGVGRLGQVAKILLGQKRQAVGSEQPGDEDTEVHASYFTDGGP